MLIDKPTAEEKRFCAYLRKKSVLVLYSIPEEQACKILELSPRGVRNLLWHQEWELETAFRVADLLGVLK